MTTSTHAKTPKSRVPVGPAIAPAIISRGPVFQPRFKNIQSGTYTWETTWAVVTVTGRLGGIHRKVLDAIFASSMADKPIDGGAHMFVIDPYRTAKIAGVAAGQPRWLLTILRDMQNADVTIIDKVTGLRHWAHIISEVWESKRRADMPGGVTHGDRPLYVVTVSAGWMKIFDSSLVVKYRNVLPALSKIESGAVHAMALHLLTHSAGSFDVAEVLRVVGAVTSETTDRHRRRLAQQIERESDCLADLGIQLYRQTDTGRLMLSYHPTGDVHVQKPAD